MPKQLKCELLFQEQCRNQIEGHKDCYHCIIWEKVVKLGYDPKLFFNKKMELVKYMKEF